METWRPWHLRALSSFGVERHAEHAMVANGEAVVADVGWTSQRAANHQLATFRESGFGYFLEMAMRPQTIGYALLD